jgi:hypothetical protein
VANPEAFETRLHPNCSHCKIENLRRKDELRSDDRRSGTGCRARTIPTRVGRTLDYKGFTIGFSSISGQFRMIYCPP